MTLIYTCFKYVLSHLALPYHYHIHDPSRFDDSKVLTHVTCMAPRLSSVVLSARHQRSDGASDLLRPACSLRQPNVNNRRRYHELFVDEPQCTATYCYWTRIANEGGYDIVGDSRRGLCCASATVRSLARPFSAPTLSSPSPPIENRPPDVLLRSTTRNSLSHIILDISTITTGAGASGELSLLELLQSFTFGGPQRHPLSLYNNIHTNKTYISRPRHTRIYNTK